MIEFLELHACSIRSKSKVATSSNGARAAIATQNSSTVSSKYTYTVPGQRTKSVGFKLAVRGDTEAGGLVAPLPCTAYFGKLAMLFGCSLP